jgi:hypothetical protein
VRAGASRVVRSCQPSGRPGRIGRCAHPRRVQFGVVCPCRVVHVVDEPRRRGFAYGTLPGHPEQGEESFTVTHEADDSVVFRVAAFSRPATLSAGQAGVARRMQDWMTDRSPSPRTSNAQPCRGTYARSPKDMC